MSYKSLILSCLFLFGSVSSEATSPNPYVKNKDWDQIEPYLIPEDHPIKTQLDELFSRSRATVSIKSMEKAGFTNVFAQYYTHIIVTKHPDFPGYIFKLYLDAQRYYKNQPEFFFYLKRVRGAEKIQRFLDEKGWNDSIKVPKKWIYALPLDPSPPDELIRKNFIIVEEDMDIYDSSMNRKMWGSDLITPDLLYKYYTVLEEIGLSDCAKPKNAPISRDGRIALVDTQTHGYWPVSYYNMDPYLSNEVRSYWKSLRK